VLTGGAVTGAGVATFYTDTSGGALKSALDVFWNAVRSAMPNNLSIVVPDGGEELDSTDGSLVGTWTGGTTTTMAGSGGTTYAQGVGARVVWNTNGITRGRRVRGSTFLVPLATAMYANDGTIDNGIVTSFSNSAAALVTALGGGLVIWSRPSTGGSDGVSHTVIGSSAPDRVSWLVSRRT
jgi:hypothetical protein